MARASKSGKGSPGFSLIEMLVVLAIIGCLAAIATPVVKGALLRAKESALRENLSVMRKLIDEFSSDRGELPQSLKILVEEGYLRAIPPDPLATDASTEWTEVPGKQGGIADVHSRSTEKGLNGISYAAW